MTRADANALELQHGNAATSQSTYRWLVLAAATFAQAAASFAMLGVARSPVSCSRISSFPPPRPAC